VLRLLTRAAGFDIFTTSHKAMKGVQGLPMQKASLLASGIMLTSIIGSPLGGWISDWWMTKRIRTRLLVPCISALLTAALISALLFYIGSRFYKKDLDKVERVALAAE
jgi:MFS family permease